jgi:hypothetical protein
MKHYRSIAFVLNLVATSACSDEVSTGSGAVGGSASQNYGQGDCYDCVKEVCSVELTQCQSEAGCASYLDCVIACRLNERGNAEEACDQACVAKTPEEAQQVVASVVSCRQDGPGVACGACGLPQGPRSAPEPQLCAPRPNPPTPCRACFWDKCCDTWDQCYGPNGNAECDAVVTCLQLCEPPQLESCTSDCFDAHPNGIDDYIAQLSCATLHCAPEVTDANMMPTCDATQRDACSSCIYSECGASFIDYIGTAEGVLMYLCLADCGSQGLGVKCIEACVEAHPQGNDAFFLWAECVDYRCGDVEGC